MRRLTVVYILMVAIKIVANDTIPFNLTGEERLIKLNEYAARYLQQNPPLAREYAIKARDLASALNSLEELCNSLNFLGLTYYYQGDYEEAISIFQQAIKSALRTGSKAQVANLFHKIGMAYLQQANYSKAIFYYQQAVKVYEQLDQLDNLARSNYQLGVVYYLAKDYTLAVEVLEQSIQQFIQIDDKRGRAKATTQLGMAYEALGNYKKALLLYQDAFQIHKNFNNQNNMAYLLNHIGMVYFKLKLYSEALSSINQALSLCEDDYWELRATLYTNLGRIYFVLEKLKEAETEFNHALSLIDSVSSNQVKADLYQGLYDLYLNMNDSKKALEFYRMFVETTRAEKLSSAVMKVPQTEPSTNLGQGFWIAFALSVFLNILFSILLIRAKVISSRLKELLQEHNILHD